MADSTFERLRWRDPVSGRRLEPIITARTPAGVPLCGALKVAGAEEAYPIVDSVVRLTPELARRYGEWLEPLRLSPPGPDAGGIQFQSETTVESFGFQWSWNSQMRSETDLRWRVAQRFRVEPEAFRSRLVLDAGAGAGDQSQWLVRQGAEVVSIDLSRAIDVVAGKLRNHRGWVGVQGDITALPWEDGEFDFVYCEGVIQHTRDSALTVRELCRMLRTGGTILATHYPSPTRWLSRVKLAYVEALRRRLRGWDAYKLLLLTGILAASGYLPILGRLLRATGTAIHYDLMPDFKTSWTNTYDTYGGHRFQRTVTAEQFWAYFESVGKMEKSFSEDTVIAARRLG